MNRISKQNGVYLYSHMGFLHLRLLVSIKLVSLDSKALKALAIVRFVS